METVTLPGTSLRVSALCPGTGEAGSSLGRGASSPRLDTIAAIDLAQEVP